MRDLTADEGYLIIRVKFTHAERVAFYKLSHSTVTGTSPEEHGKILAETDERVFKRGRNRGDFLRLLQIKEPEFWTSCAVLHRPS